MAVGGNKTAVFQVKNETAVNEIGEQIPEWIDQENLTGWLDLLSDGGGKAIMDAKVQESTHLFLCDYKVLSGTAENSRFVIDGKIYNIMLIDDPMYLHAHLEIYLKYIDGQDNGDQGG